MLKNSALIGYVADISDRGFKVRIMEKFEGELAFRETAGIQFDECGVPYFQLAALLRWRRDEEKSTLIGFELESFETDEAKTRYAMIREKYGT